MKVLLQRVSSASVEAGGQTIASIASGLLIFLGIELRDNESTAHKLAQRVLHYRLFSDSNGLMNLNIG